MANLKPCPFCNSSSDLVVRGGYKTRITCYVCLANGPGMETSSQAIEAWNKAHDKPLGPNLGRAKEEQKNAERSVEMIDENELRRQQRFELVKAAMSGMDTYGYRSDIDFYARLAVGAADAILKKLEEK